MIQDAEITSFEAFQDSLSTTVIAKLAPDPKRSRKRAVKGRKNEIKPVVKTPTNDDNGEDAGELSDFVEVRGPIVIHLQKLKIISFSPKRYSYPSHQTSVHYPTQQSKTIPP